MAGLIRSALVAALLTLPAPLLAHGLTVFAFVEDGMVVVEAKFSSGKRPVGAVVEVFDGSDRLMTTLPMEEPGLLRFPLDSVDASGGLRVQVRASEGHEDYWILTPADLAGDGG